MLPHLTTAPRRIVPLFRSLIPRHSALHHQSFSSSFGCLIILISGAIYCYFPTYSRRMWVLHKWMQCAESLTKSRVPPLSYGCWYWNCSDYEWSWGASVRWWIWRGYSFLRLYQPLQHVIDLTRRVWYKGYHTHLQYPWKLRLVQPYLHEFQSYLQQGASFRTWSCPLQLFLLYACSHGLLLICKWRSN